MPKTWFGLYPDVVGYISTETGEFKCGYKELERVLNEAEAVIAVIGDEQEASYDNCIAYAVTNRAFIKIDPDDEKKTALEFSDDEYPVKYWGEVRYAGYVLEMSNGAFIGVAPYENFTKSKICIDPGDELLGFMYNDRYICVDGGKTLIRPINGDKPEFAIPDYEQIFVEDCEYTIRNGSKLVCRRFGYFGPMDIAIKMNGPHHVDFVCGNSIFVGNEKYCYDYRGELEFICELPGDIVDISGDFVLYQAGDVCGIWHQKYGVLADDVMPPITRHRKQP